MKKLGFFLLLITLLFSCREDTDIIDPPTGPEPKIIVNASVYGVVTDDSGSRLSDATVSYNNQVTTTDDYGVFSFNDSDLYQDGTYITVSKEGFMQGSRMFYPNVNQNSHIEVQLIRKEIKGTVNSANGGKVAFNGASIDFPANGIINEDGTDYSGSVNVMAKYLDPSAPETFREMPGDLVGINSENNQMALATYGMLGVELEDASGNPLQIKEGFTASIEVPVPQSHLSTAPSEIPLWHFDEETGYWIEEGSATLVNGIYQGEVSHFSFWNCDAPFPLINLTGSIFINNVGYEGIKVQIVDNSTGYAACGLTSDRGYFAGKVPQDQDLTLNVLDECGEIIYTEDIGSFSDDSNIPIINISNIASTINITGSLSNCNGDVIEDGYVFLSFGNNISYTYPIEDDQSFDININNCNATEAQIVGVDQTNDLATAPILIDLTGNLNIGGLEACDEFYERVSVIEYLGSAFAAGNTTAATYEQTVFPNKSLYTITLLNWNTAETMSFTVVLQNGEVTANYTVEFENDGFSCTGTATMFKTIDALTGNQMLIFQSTTTDITVTDSSIFDPAITEVVFDIGI